MAGVSRKISELDLAAPLVLSDQLGVERGATENLRTSISDLKALIHSAFTMQEAYDNSTGPQVTTTTPLGSVDFKRGSAADTDNVLRVLSGGGASVFSVDGNGFIFVGSNIETTGSFINIGSGASAGTKSLILQEGIETVGIRFDEGVGAVITSSAAGNTVAIQSDAGVLNATFSGGVGAELLALVGDLNVGGDVDVVGTMRIASTGVVIDVGLGGSNLIIDPSNNYSGVAASTNADHFVIQHPTSQVGSSFIGSTVSAINIFAGDTDDPTEGRLIYSNTDDSWRIHTATILALEINSSQKLLAKADMDIAGTLTGGNLPFDIGVFFPDIPGDAELMLQYVFTRSVDFLDDFAGSEGAVVVNPTSQATIVIRKNAGNIGTVVISTGGVVTFTTSGGTISFAAGDTLELVNQGTADATMADISITLKGTRT